jgi:3-deoxy-D-arabino-heptulosonate 7-phosphate (DAHP) synthase
MSNIKTKIDEWEVRDLEDNGVLRVYVEHNTEMGNQGVPGIQVWYTVAGGTSIVNFEPNHVERWAYQAQKANQTDYVLTDYSWLNHEDMYVKNSLVVEENGKLKARVSVKVRSKKEAITKEYELPFELG